MLRASSASNHSHVRTTTTPVDVQPHHPRPLLPSNAAEVDREQQGGTVPASAAAAIAAQEQHDQHHETAQTMMAFMTREMANKTVTSPTSRREVLSRAAQPPVYHVLSSSIGLGIHTAPSSSDDATEAAAKAVADALERGQLLHLIRMNHHHKTLEQGLNVSSPSHLYLQVKLGVPPPTSSADGANHPMALNAQRLMDLFPREVTLSPFEIVAGGLHVEQGPSDAPFQVITVVASVTLQARHESDHNPAVGTTLNASSVATTPVTTTTKATHSFRQLPSSQLPATGTASIVPMTWAADAGVHPSHGSSHVPESSLEFPNPNHVSIDDDANPNHPPLNYRSAVMAAVPIPSSSSRRLPPLGLASSTGTAAPTSPSNIQVVNGLPLRSSHLANRTNSMEMLARISAEIHQEQGEELHQAQEEDYSGQAEADQPNDEDAEEQTENSSTSPDLQGMSFISSAAAAAAAAGASTAYNYRKLPPGITPKKNQRLFVKHQYRDHSSELPRSDELELLTRNNGTSSPTIRTPNAAFPLKLHETLKQIELDGFDHILGWLPHGRSFKIFQQKEFVDLILPRYFVMTKKSSFLRQLNLYGFNRLSGLGPDQGSYYHEKFLRGMKFLSKRMQRQKVNGNGIRAAGDPDSEPNLRVYPPCPPVRLGERPPAPLLVVPPPVMVLAEAAMAASVASSASSSPIPKAKKVRTSASRAVGSTIAATGIATTVSSPASTSSKVKSPTPGAASAMEGPSILSSDESLHVTNSSTVQITINSILRGVQVSFPLKLQRILDKLEADGETDVLGWLPHGRAFLVNDPRRFVDELMPKYFNQSKFSSFQRQLHMYSFNRITASGRDKGAYHHPYFLRGNPEMAMKMRRTRINGKGTRRPGNPNLEPDFYGMPTVPTVSPGTVIDIPTEMVAGTTNVTSSGGSALPDHSRRSNTSRSNGSSGTRRRRTKPVGGPNGGEDATDVYDHYDDTIQDDDERSVNSRSSSSDSEIAERNVETDDDEGSDDDDNNSGVE